MAEGGGDFSTTAWTVVEQAGSDREALDRLLRRYWMPLWTHLVRTMRLSESEADDVLQEFLTSRILERNLLSQAKRDRGKFRWFLVTALNNFLKDRRRANAAKKAAPNRAQGIEEQYYLASPNQEVGGAFETGWALAVVAETVRRMEVECNASGRSDLWTAFQARAGRIVQGQEPLPYSALAEQLNTRDEKQAANLWGTAQMKFQRILQQVLVEFGAENVKEELRELKQAITACGKELLESLWLQFWSEHPAMSAESQEATALNANALVALWTKDESSGTSSEERWRELLQSTIAPVTSGEGIKPISTLLEDPKPSVQTLERIKDFAKDMRGSAQEESAAEAATALYYACIAVGLASTGTLITDQDKAALKQGFAWAQGRPWLDEQSRAWLKQATGALS